MAFARFCADHAIALLLQHPPDGPGHAALYASLRPAASFPEAVTCAIGLGGDTDTIAAMSGALTGAHQSEGAIPALRREQVEGAGALRELAAALLAAGAACAWRSAPGGARHPGGDPPGAAG